ncbi:MAG: nucleotidyl transferase AbiEii/AbiGii toxin family protein [Planctomycetota bacterium]
MIPKDFITEWRSQAPWVTDAQVEQDLVISRALVEIFREPQLATKLAFRGGTALFKLHLQAARYSEDIDLVQVAPEPIGQTFAAIRAVLDPWLGEPRRTIKEASVSLVYRFTSEEVPPKPMRLKVEINSREHFTEHGHVHHRFELRSRWWSGRADITTFSLEELLGTKLRALFQRRKGRDLFDLWYALQNGADPQKIVTCFARYMQEANRAVTRAEFGQNLTAKLADPVFRADLSPLLRTGIAWDADAAGEVVLAKLVARLPDEPRKRPKRRG